MGQEVRDGRNVPGHPRLLHEGDHTYVPLHHHIDGIGIMYVYIVTGTYFLVAGMPILHSSRPSGSLILGSRIP